MSIILTRRIEKSGVAPFTGAWIEIPIARNMLGALTGRTLHGCVD